MDSGSATDLDLAWAKASQWPEHEALLDHQVAGRTSAHSDREIRTDPIAPLTRALTSPPST